MLRGCREKGILLHWWWECKLVQPLWRTIWRSLKYTHTHTQTHTYITTILPSNPTLGRIFRENHNLKRYIDHNVLGSTIHNSQDMEGTQMSNDRGIKKMRYIHSMEYDPVIKQNEIRPLAATWMNLKIIILSEVSQTEEDKQHMTSFICGI